jgi:poly-gamma-glutamate synthesis protein (capsule biosynthesis protein)
VVTLANNHTMDCGPEGLRLTLETSAAAGLKTIGAGANLEEARRPLLCEVRGRKVAWLAYGQIAEGAAERNRPGVSPLRSELVEEDLRRWRSQADLLVVSAHWGSMYVDYPPPRVTAMARLMADGGADLVLGHHPHVLQGIQRLGRTLVVYSLGDIAFNCRAGEILADVAGESRQESAVLTARFSPEAAPRLLRYELDGARQLLRKGRLDRVLRLLLSIRPRHLPLLWQAVRRRKPGI